MIRGKELPEEWRNFIKTDEERQAEFDNALKDINSERVNSGEITQERKDEIIGA